MNGKKIGYIRVSTTDQNTDRQLEGVDLDKIFTEKISGKDVKRPQLQNMLEFVREGDHVFVHELSRLGRSMIDLHQLVEKINKQGATVSFVKENIEFSPGKQSDPVKNAMFGMLSVFSEFERSLIKQRQAEGIAAAKAAGKHLGRPELLSKSQKKDILRKKSTGITPTALAKQFGVSRATIYNVIKG